MLLRERLRALYPGASGRTIKGWLEAGRVSVDGRVVRRGDVVVTDGARVTLGEPPAQFPSSLHLVHEDDDLLVVDKPAGLLTIATERERDRTAYRMLREYVHALPGRVRLFIVHRLDRETSGLLVFAKSPEAKRRLQAQFEARTVERGYVAVVDGRVAASGGTLGGLLHEDRARRVRPGRGPGAREAITRYRVLERRRGSTVLELTLETGRRGQIRAQLAALGHPITGDRAYGSRRDPIRRLCLHATRLGFTSPRGGRMAFESRIPGEFRRA
ncbi:MAG: RNA pseudouridine synthase [Candidatus Rokubacteria bacterium]|nr:RNA pseudouridine synthase [Candidatus Rokubacteria bacterium]